MTLTVDVTYQWPGCSQQREKYSHVKRIERGICRGNEMLKVFLSPTDVKMYNAATVKDVVLQIEN